jgi:phenylpropionate dioxygenase-like ring-hydroxylating dioxygenase large terminal subunit
MNQNLIPPSHYYQPDVFDTELALIYQKEWLFGCMKDDLPNENDYFVLEIAKFSVIFYNNGQNIVALQNVCPHRFNRIVLDKKGNAPLVCKFHSWAFDGCGKIQSNRIKSPEAIAQYSLKQYPTEEVGEFVFFSFNTNIQHSLKEQYGPLIDDIALTSSVLGKRIHEDNIPHEVNWKIICENIIEVSHCQSLHQDSLVKIGYCQKPVEEFGQELNNSYMIVPPVEDKAREKRDKFLAKNLPRAIQNNKYKHILYFPNFTIGIYEGLNITIGAIIPIGPTKSVYRLLYYTAKIDSEKGLSQSILDSMTEDTIAFGTQVFNEDKVIIEQIQKGVQEIDHSGMVYDSDKRVLWFMASYLNIMNNG